MSLNPLFAVRDFFFSMDFLTEEILMSIPVAITSLCIFLVFGWVVYGVYTGKIGFSSMDKKVKIFLAILVVLAAVIRFSAPPKFGAAGGDELFYVEVSEQVWSTGRYTVPELVGQETVFFKPYYLYILLAAPLTGFLEPLVAGRILNIFLGSLTVLGVFFLAREFFGDDAGIAAGFLTVFLPLGIHLSHTTETQVLSVLLMSFLIPVFKRYLEEESFFHGLGSVLLLASLVLTRSFNWIFVPVFGLILVFSKGFSGDDRVFYPIYLIVFGVLTFFSFLQNIEFGFREGGGEAGFFGFSNLVKNVSGLVPKFLDSFFYIPFVALGLTGLVLSFKEKRSTWLLWVPLAVYTVSITMYRYTIQAYPMPKFYYMTSVLLIPYAGNLFVKLFRTEKFRVFSVVLLVLIGFIGGLEALGYDREMQTVVSQELVDYVEDNHPECGIVMYDGGPVRAVSDRVPLNIPHEEIDVDWYRENIGECIVYLRIERVETENVRRFEENFDIGEPVYEREPVRGEFGRKVLGEVYRIELG